MAGPLETVRRWPVNRWLTWRARLEHLLFPVMGCLCHVCAAERERQRMVVKTIVEAGRPAPTLVKLEKKDG